MQDLFIDINEVREHSKRVDASNQQHLSELDSFSNVMSGLIEHWDSPSANVLYEEFQTFAPIFQKYFDHINSYKEFLDQTVETYELLDKAIESGIEVS